MVRTRVGYAGGEKDSPTYYSLGDHSETAQIDYDPARITYEDLLEVFWKSHTPTSRSWSRQYASIIFYHDEEQKRAAEESRDREQERRGKEILTELVPYTRFHLAEDYHQKYYLRGVRELMEEFEAMYPNTADFTNSTAAARLNGYVAGYGLSESLQKELDSYGLSPEGLEILVGIACLVQP